MIVEKKPLLTELIGALLANYKKPENLIGHNGLLKQLTKALVERALQAEMTDHLGHNKNQGWVAAITSAAIRPLSTLSRSKPGWVPRLIFKP